MATPMLPHEMCRRARMTASVLAAIPAPAAPEKLRLSDLDWICNLGAGGLASVCKARHCRTGAVFAVKISFDQDPLVVEKEAEVLKIAAGATHVIDFYAVLREPGYKAALVLEYMDAGSLGSLLRRRRRGGLRIPEAAVAEVAMQCVQGLLQLHYRGIAHLDVKPDNILANSRGEIKFSDLTFRGSLAPARCPSPAALRSTSAVQPRAVRAQSPRWANRRHEGGCLGPRRHRPGALHGATLPRARSKEPIC
ncbi:Mitogen-activated protein kinase kinase 2 [Zea mays]|jgi:mitogen-activated protein kinase kinase 9|uniref:Mitogen-activated protein kinase kinase 2 n=1 Tax=Zea mays TaxID=4577 RepID=A0A3L6FGP2_MAIZE|nr:Mitogen-activated protein kinase kinase 2 [Zea mays]